MRILIDWLDTRHIWGPAAPLFTRLGALMVVVGISAQIIASLESPKPTALAPSPILPAHANYSAAESLFRGPQRAVHAQRSAETLADAQRCLAQAIYFEARSEPLAGWNAVADVVINRAFSSRYPASICGVVFQGEFRRHKCQFSFACDGLSDRPKNRVLWQRALRMAGSKLTSMRAGPATRRATHYHADYVDPYWNRDMVKLAKIGRHIFYTDRRSADF